MTTQPTLLVREKFARKHIYNMVQKANDSEVQFRPHFKTHQSTIIGEWFREESVNAITVSSLNMAKTFSQAGWHDIMMAVPFNPKEFDLINELASQIKLHLITDSQDSVETLASNCVSQITMWIEIDTGDHRTGIPWEDISTITKIIELIDKTSQFNCGGIMTHAGHSYRAGDVEEISNIYSDSVNKLMNVQNRLMSRGYKVSISIGDTPSCATQNAFPGVDEIRPGNFVFFDIMQTQIGSCTIEDIAIAVSCPVVSKNQSRLEWIIHGGAVHLSKDYVTIDGVQCFGKVALLNDKDWGTPLPHTAVTKLSQEHGVVQCDLELFNKVNIGDNVAVLPIHACLTMNLLRNNIQVI